MGQLIDLPTELLEEVYRRVRVAKDVSAFVRSCRRTHQLFCHWPKRNSHWKLCILMHAIEHNNVEEFDRALEICGGDINHGCVATACYRGRLDFLKRLLAVPCVREKALAFCETWTNLLCIAAAKGHVDVLHYLLAQELMSLDWQPNSVSCKPLIAALKRKEGSDEIVAMLLEGGANPRAVVGDGYRAPIVVAVESGNVAGLRMLLEADVKGDYRCGETEQTALLLAQRHPTKAFEMTKLLLGHGADGSDGRALGCAVSESLSDCVILLLEHGADVSHVHGEGPLGRLIYVVEHCDVEACKAYLKAFAKRSKLRIFNRAVWRATERCRSSDRLWRALEDPAFNSLAPKREDEPSPTDMLGHVTSVAEVEVLVRRGADPTANGLAITTVLNEGCLSAERKVEIIEALVAHGADVNLCGSAEGLLRNEMDYFRRRLTIPVLIDSGLKVTQGQKNELLILCARGIGRGNFAKHVVKPLVDWGADINAARDMDGRPLLLRALAQDHYNVLGLLLSLGANPLAVHHETGATALHSVRHDRTGLGPRTVRMLLARGVDASAEDRCGMTPLDAALGTRCPDIMRCLIKEGGVDVHRLRVIKASKCRITSLHYAVSLNPGGAHSAENTDGIRGLIAVGVDWNVKDDRGRTPLHWARSMGYSRVARLLVKAGADVDDEDKKGNVAGQVRRGLYPELETLR